MANPNELRIYTGSEPQGEQEGKMLGTMEFTHEPDFPVNDWYPDDYDPDEDLY